MSSTDCSHCGEPIQKGMRACGYCGAPVRARWSPLAIAAVLDFAWLETAMKLCDEQAAKDDKGLHYLVIPLVDEPRDEPGWRRISINDIGNAILIGGEDMLAGLRRKALRISTDEYVFSARNETTKDVLTWKPSTGVRKFVINDASGIQQFKVQFQSSDAARAINWGATFERQAGNCYWVNAILRH
jgi:hypothetical protein